MNNDKVPLNGNDPGYSPESFVVVPPGNLYYWLRKWLSFNRLGV